MPIYRRPNSPYWWGRFRFRGKQHRKSLDTAVEVVARKRLKEWQAGVEAGLITQKTGGKTYDDAVVSFMEEHLPTLSPSSASRYVTSMVHLARSFEGKQLSEITRASLHEFEMRRRAEVHLRGSLVSPSTIRRDMRCLSSIFSHCIAKEWAEANPVSVYMLARRRHGALKQGAPKTRYWSHDEEAAVLAAAGETNDALRVGIILSVDVGMRKEELLGLKWEHLDLVKREITLAPERTKNKKGRVIPILPRSLRELEKLERKGPFVLWHSNGERYTSLSPQFRRAVMRAKVKHTGWHDMRRTCGCRLLQDHGMSMERVSKWLGHSSVDVTEKSYAFLEIRHLHDAIKKEHTGEHTPLV
jgi:integrase